LSPFPGPPFSRTRFIWFFPSPPTPPEFNCKRVLPPFFRTSAALVLRQLLFLPGVGHSRGFCTAENRLLLPIAVFWIHFWEVEARLFFVVLWTCALFVTGSLGSPCCFCCRRRSPRRPSVRLFFWVFPCFLTLLLLGGRITHFERLFFAGFYEGIPPNPIRMVSSHMVSKLNYRSPPPPRCVTDQHVWWFVVPPLPLFPLELFFLKSTNEKNLSQGRLLLCLGF